MSAETQSRVVFMGTPDFAVPSLDTLLQAADFHVAGVVTQPDRPAGRGQTVRVSPVKALAERARVPVIQPEKVREPDAIHITVADGAEGLLPLLERLDGD